MICKHSQSMGRAAAFAAALFAITLNFLQPLVHAALMRDGGPATSGLWSSMCLPDVSGEGRQGSTPAGKLHECCLGFTDTQALATPSAFIFVERIVTTKTFVVDVDSSTVADIRDGPNQPRAPPFSA